MNYVIIGASAAGLSTAEEIRKYDKDGTITILTEESYLPYSRPSISYYLKNKVSEKDMYLRKSSYYKTNDIDIVTDSKVTAINTEEKFVKVSNKKYSYDKLCLCTGSKPFVPPMKNIEGKSNALTFLDMAATKQIKDVANENTKVVVIGAGLIGMKAAEGLSAICKSVDVVELAPRILPSILDAKSSKNVKKYIEQKGNIKFHLENTVVEGKTKNNAITSVVLKSGKELKCDLVILAVGVRPETTVAQLANLEINRGIIIDNLTMQTSNKDIYAAGDCTVSVDKLDGSKKIIALWPNAVNQGIVAGSQMAGVNTVSQGAYAVNAIDFYGLRICTCGIINPNSDEYFDQIKTDGDAYKRLVFCGDKLVGYVLINSSDNAGLYTYLISEGVDITTIEGDIMDTPSLFMFNKDVRKTKLTGGIDL